MRTKIAVLIFLCFVFSLSSQANFVGNDTSNFNPLPNGLDFVTVHGSQVLEPGLMNTGFFINQAKNSLPDTYMGGTRINSNDSMVFGDLSLAYGWTSRFETAVSFSYLISQETDRLTPGAQFAGTGWNEIRAAAKYKVSDRNPAGTALIVSANFNQTRSNPFHGRGDGPTLNLEGAADIRLGETLLAANAGYRLRQNGDAIQNSVFEPLPDQWIASVAASRYFPQVNLKLIGEIFASKPTRSVRYVSSDHISSEALLGVKYDQSRNLSLHAGGGTRLGEGLFTPDWRIYVGANYAFETNSHREAAPATIVQPPAQIHMLKGYHPRDIEKLKDQSFDLISKNHEFHPQTEVPTGGESSSKPPFEIIRLNNFDFDFGSSAIRAEYEPLLNKLADYLNQLPRVLKIRVEGHTDSLGSLERNRIRSQERADNLKAYLIRRGLPANATIESIGFGADRPIADNSNFQGRRQNRRVEIRILREIPPLNEIIQ